MTEFRVKLNIKEITAKGASDKWFMNWLFGRLLKEAPEKVRKDFLSARFETVQ